MNQLHLDFHLFFCIFLWRSIQTRTVSERTEYHLLAVFVLSVLVEKPRCIRPGVFLLAYAVSNEQYAPWARCFPRFDLRNLEPLEPGSKERPWEIGKTTKVRATPSRRPATSWPPICSLRTHLMDGLGEPIPPVIGLTHSGAKKACGEARIWFRWLYPSALTLYWVMMDIRPPVWP